MDFFIRDADSLVPVEVKANVDGKYNITVNDRDYEVYIYTFQRGEVIYSFVCPDMTGYFKFYYISQNVEDAA